MGTGVGRHSEATPAEHSRSGIAAFATFPCGPQGNTRRLIYLIVGISCCYLLLCSDDVPLGVLLCLHTHRRMRSSHNLCKPLQPLALLCIAICCRCPLPPCFGPKLRCLESFKPTDNEECKTAPRLLHLVNPKILRSTQIQLNYLFRLR